MKSVDLHRDPCAQLREAFRKRSRLSIRAASRRMGYRSHRALGMVLEGKRLPSPRLLAKLSRQLGFSDMEESRLRRLVELKRTGEEPDAQSLARIEDPLRGTLTLPPEKFDPLSDWYLFVVKQLIECPSFEFTPRYLEARLGRQVPVHQIIQAIEKMLRLGLLRREKKTGRLVVEPGKFRSTHDVPSATIRRYHRLWLKRVAESIERHAVDERENLSLTLRFDRSRVGEAKQFLRYVREEFDRRFAPAPGDDDVFQLAMHFFPVTEPVVRTEKL